MLLVLRYFLIRDRKGDDADLDILERVEGTDPIVCWKRLCGRRHENEEAKEVRNEG